MILNNAKACMALMTAAELSMACLKVFAERWTHPQVSSCVDSFSGHRHCLQATQPAGTAEIAAARCMP